MGNFKLSVKILALIVLGDVMDSVSQVFMKKGLEDTGVNLTAIANLPEFIIHGAASPMIWIGIFIYVSSFFIWIIVLSRTDLSIATPLGSVTYIITPLMAVFFLHEHVSLVRWLGIMFIILGIYFISRSKHLLKEGT